MKGGRGIERMGGEEMKYPVGGGAGERRRKVVEEWRKKVVVDMDKSGGTIGRVEWWNKWGNQGSG